MRKHLKGLEMKVHLDCFPCFMRQAVIACNLSGDDRQLHERVIKGVLHDIEHTDMESTPAHATTYMHRTIRTLLGRDPFEAIKREYNQKALARYPSLKRNVAQSADPLHTATRLAIAGNIIDFGIFTSVNIEGTIESALNEPLAVDDYPAFKDAIASHTRIMYLLDNTGEAVFDRILIEELIAMGKRVTAVAKGGPVINDCTMQDAEEAGITDICEVIDNGTDAIGTILEMTSPEFRARYRENGALVISKGQGNFESLLGDKGGDVFYLFQSKCDVVARVLDLPRGSMLLVGNAI